MKPMVGLFLVWLLLGLTPGAAEEKEAPPLLYPFTVTLGGQKAEMKDRNDLFAVVPKPVKADAALVLEKKADMLIVNAFPCQDDGKVLENQAAGIIFAKETAEVKLNATMDKKVLKPGTYLMNVVAHGKTSRVVFTVADSKGKVKLPDLKKIVDFLRNKK